MLILLIYFHSKEIFDDIETIDFLKIKKKVLNPQEDQLKSNLIFPC